MQGNEKNVGHSSLNAKSNEILSVQLTVKIYIKFKFTIKECILVKKKEKLLIMWYEY